MSKKILAVFFLLIILAVGGQSAFWFFKTSQLERHLTKYSKTTDGNVSIDRFEISGFPLKQNVSVSNLKVKVPEPFSKNNEVVFQKVNLSSSIFSDIFSVDFVGIAILKTNNIVNNIEFDQTPSATLQIDSNGVKKFVYNDKGYRIFGPDKNLLTRSGPSNVEFSSSNDSSERIISRIKISSKNTESFDLASLYENHYEKEVIDGIKTGKIQIGLKELEQEHQKPTTQESEEMAELIKNNQAISPESLNAEFEKNMAKQTEEAQIAKQNPEQLDQNATAGEIPNSDDTVVAENIANPDMSQETIEQAKEDSADATNVEQMTVENVAEVKNNLAKNIPDELADIKEEDLEPQTTAENDEKNNATKENKEEELAKLEDSIKEEAMKNDIEIDIEYILTPVKSEAGQVTDPTKIAQIVTKYSKSYKINKFEISNEKFKMNINGQLERDRGDINFSGFATLKIDQTNNFIDYIKSSLIKVNNNDLQIKSFDPSYNSSIVRNGYSSFISVISEKLLDVMTEIATKNKLTQDDSMVFDIRREKNLDIIINETPMREIVGKF